MRLPQAAAICCLLAATACTSNAREAEPEPTVSASAEPVLRTFAETCLLVGQAFSADDPPSVPVLEALRDGGDIKTQAELEKLPSITGDLAGARGTDLLDARAALRAELDRLAGECEAAGSDALS